MDFTVTVLQSGVGLPEPEAATIADLNTFDAARLTGGERYQCRRIRLEGAVVSELTGGSWGSNQDVVIADAEDPDNPDKQILLALRNVDFGTQAPQGPFNIVGLGNQEPQFDGTPVPGTGLTDGYQVWVTRADGIIASGDGNEDGRVSYLDVGIVATNYGRTGVGWSAGDFTGDGAVTYLDLGLLTTNYGYGPSGGGVCPEPVTLIPLALGLWAALRPRRAERRK